MSKPNVTRYVILRVFDAPPDNIKYDNMRDIELVFETSNLSDAAVMLDRAKEKSKDGSRVELYMKLGEK